MIRPAPTIILQLAELLAASMVLYELIRDVALVLDILGLFPPFKKHLILIPVLNWRETLGSFSFLVGEFYFCAQIFNLL